MNITDHIINIEGSSVADRLRLRQVLLDNNQKLISHKSYGWTILNLGSNSLVYSTTKWVFTSKNVSTISLQQFIERYKKQDTLRNLAFYKRSGTPWTTKECENIVRFCNSERQIKYMSWGNVDPTHKFVFPDSANDYANWTLQEKHSKFNDCLQVTYEDVFPVPTRKFNIGDTIRNIYNPLGEWVIDHITDDRYYHTNGNYTLFKDEYKHILVPSKKLTPEPISTTKEDTMSQITIQQLLTQLFGAEKPTTDYDRRPSLLVVAYNLDGSQIGTATASDLKEVETKLSQTPSLWGCKVLTYKLDKELCVKVPVSTSKASVATPATDPESTEE